MANDYYIKLIGNVREWNQFRGFNLQIIPDLTEAKLVSSYLERADLRNVDLHGANLAMANLREADLAMANLREANLTGADLYQANFDKTIFGGTILANVDLRNVRNLSRVFHARPSRMTLHNILLPREEIARHFLQGAGIPPERIDFYISMTGQSLHYHSCFISYASEDEILANKLYADLQTHGVHCWFAPFNSAPGDYFREKIEQAIHQQDKLLLILSEASLRSHWVEYEVDQALALEGEQQRTILFPITIDQKIFRTRKPWAKYLQKVRTIGDFAGWESNTIYTEKFQQLLKKLKMEKV